MSLFAHQQKILEDDPSRCGIWLGTGGGKTRIALCLAKGRTLIVAPKTQFEDKNWQREKEKLSSLHEVDITVISKETFRKVHHTLETFDTLIIDEAHTVLGVSPAVVWKNRQPVPKTSQLFDSVLRYISTKRPSRFYLVTATPDRSPFAVWGAAKLLGRDMDFDSFRREYYVRLPMPGREVWAPKRDKDTKDKLAELVRSLGYVGRLQDWFDVPEQTHRTEWFNMTPKQKQRIDELKMEFTDPLVRFGKIDQVENGCLAKTDYTPAEFFPSGKIDRILDLALEFPRLLIFAKYSTQIEAIKRALEDDGRKVLTLTGQTPNKGDVIAEANKLEECVVIAQSQISSGYELPEYPCTVFASLSGSLVDLVQAQGRTLRANALAKKLYIYLVTRGKADQARYEANMNKRDFHEAIFVKSESYKHDHEYA